jgi:hypothetical protein
VPAHQWPHGNSRDGSIGVFDVHILIVDELSIHDNWHTGSHATGRSRNFLDWPPRSRWHGAGSLTDPVDDSC